MYLEYTIFGDTAQSRKLKKILKYKILKEYINWQNDPNKSQMQSN